MSVNTYSDAITFLLDRTDWEKRSLGLEARKAWSLDRPHALLAALGHPEKDYRAIHVAGTNGKGSVAASIDSILRAAGFRVGLYTQPHLHDYCERVRLHGKSITKAALVNTVQRLAPVAEQLEQDLTNFGRLTTFELGTALAFQYFSDATVDWGVIEVGLGGRLDATNVLKPAISVITSLSMDHTALLGKTLTDIATEKAGIIKSGVPVVSASQQPEAATVLERIASERDAPLFLGGRDFTWTGDHRAAMVLGDEWGYSGLELALVGRHQLENAALAVNVIERLRATADLEVPTQAVRRGLLDVRWPARVEVLQEEAGRPTVICDGAHNESSAQRLAETIREWFPYQDLYLIVGTSADHDLKAIMAELSILEAVTVFPVASTHPRATRAQDIGGQLNTLGCLTEAPGSIGEAMLEAGARACPGDIILIAGSLFVAAEASAVFDHTTESCD